MASMACFPFGVKTKTDSSVLLHSAFFRRPTLPSFAFRLRTVHNLARGPSKFGDDRSNSNGGWSRRRILVEAIGNALVGEEENDGKPDDAFQATIEKSKKILAVQRDLLQQIAERRKLVSSIKTSTLNSEVEEVLSHAQDRPFSNEALESTESETMIPGQMSKEKLFSNQRIESIDSGTTNAGYNNDSLSTGYSNFIAKKPSNSTPSIGQSDFGEEKKEFEQKLSVDTATLKVDSSERLRDTNLENVQSDNLPAFLSIPFEISSSEKETIRHSEEKRSNEILSQLSDQDNEDNKLPPLAGVNVMNLILIAAECAPWSKTGGLADVAGALPKALARRGHRVMVIVPRYGNYAEAQETGIRKIYKIDGQDNEVTYFHAFIDGVDFVFVDTAMFRNFGNNIYGGNRMDILKRMILFCKAAVEVPWHVPCGGVCYGDGNLVFIANDWHTALLPVYLKAYYRDNGLMTYTRSLLVVHNIAHQGRGPLTDFSYVGLPQHYVDLFKLYDPVGGEHFNIFAAGLKTADRVVTVSHGYAWELKTVEGGWGLHGIINENDWKLAGIVNGIDTNDWDPQVDVHLTSDGYTNYSLETLKTGKTQCKAALQKELGLPIREDVPLLAFIGRLDGQKGVDIIAEAIPWMMGQDVQLVMLGTGRDDLEQMLKDFEIQYQGRVRSWVGFSVKMAHRITAGVDILLMPSRFEPCGLNQLYAMVYGTVPVVHAVGGLRDTVQQFDPYNECGLGWTFDRAEANRLIDALGNCLLTFREYKNSWEGIQRRGMSQNLSWDIAAQKYEEILVAAKYHW